MILQPEAQVKLTQKNTHIYTLTNIMELIQLLPVMNFNNEFENKQRAYQGLRNVCFSEILACFAFLKHPF